MEGLLTLLLECPCRVNLSEVVDMCGRRGHLSVLRRQMRGASDYVGVNEL